MKRILFATVLTVTAYAASAQINKGQWLAGGNVGFESNKWGNAYKTTTFTFSPDAGYFFIDKLAGGLRISYTSVKPKDVKATNTFMAAPFVRYYFLDAAQKVNLFAEGSYGFGSVKQTSSQSFSGYSFKAGPAIFLTPSVALELGIGYNSMKYKDISDRDNTFGAIIGFQVHLGSGGGSKK